MSKTLQLPSGASNPSVLLSAPHTATISDLPIPQLQNSTDVIVRIAFTGVCGSDVHFWHDGGHGIKVSPSTPAVMGHEAAGIVHTVGAGVTNVQIGDRVAIEPGSPCRVCARCKAGRYHLCEGMLFAASPADPSVPGAEMLNGTLAKFFLIPGDFLYKLPEHVSLEEGVLVEPLAVAVHSARTVGVKPDDVVVVFGAGTVGMLCAAVAREMGARKVVAVDISERKLEFVRSWAGEGIETYKSGMEKSAEETAADISKLHGLGLGADVVIEASGATSAIHAGIGVLQKGGSYIQTGLGKERIDFPMMMVCEKEITMKGHFRYGAGDFEMAVGLLARKKIDVKSLISKIFEFEQAVEAWEATGRGEGVKNLIRGVKD